jgi:hypothetical protein
MKNIFQLESETRIPKTSYIISYPHMISYFRSLDEITVPNFVCGAHMIYGWMPTILDLYPDNSESGLVDGAKILTEAQRGTNVTDEQIRILASLVNNSLIGASKLLHFVNPNSYPIWDSKIYRFFFEERAHEYRVKKIEKFREYQSYVLNIVSDPHFKQFHESINNKVGYKVTPVRAIELVMFLNSN